MSKSQNSEALIDDHLKREIKKWECILERECCCDEEDAFYCVDPNISVELCARKGIHVTDKYPETIPNLVFFHSSVLYNPIGTLTVDNIIFVLPIVYRKG